MTVNFWIDCPNLDENLCIRVTLLENRKTTNNEVASWLNNHLLALLISDGD